MSKQSIIENPILSSKYNELTNSPDKDAKNIVYQFTNIYDNYVIFTKTSDTVVDTTGLDNIATQIENSFNNINLIITPCVTDMRAPMSNYDSKCSDNVCKWAGFIEYLMMDFFVLITNMTNNVGDIKSQYKFLGFIALNNFNELITSTDTNYNPFVKKYYLCSDTSYQPPSSDPELQKLFNTVQSRMATQQANKNTRQNDNMIQQFLSYILLPTVIFIILILLYLKYTKKTSDNVPISTTDSEHILTNGTTSPETPTKTGGAFYDTLNFITTIGLTLFRV